MSAVRLISRRVESLDEDLVKLAEICELVIKAFAASAEMSLPERVDKSVDVYVHLATGTECTNWDVPEDALGFHAISSSRRYDSEEDEYYVNTSERHEVFINLEAGRHLLNRSGPWLECDLEAWLVTIPHEVFHALEWIQETGGLTPDEVYAARVTDGDEWPEVVSKVLRAIDKRLENGQQSGPSSEFGATEDIIEQRARDWFLGQQDLVAELCATLYGNKENMSLRV
ncbi:hypothetical protein ACFOY8_13655 [Thalassospira xianhensis]|uniref:Uncharacterized protein n=1 Tax=Thalassospira xianhensis MCCC 1A02616 TaxID=1177929 RepID=A0A367UIC0_9PROT|nr:hypothetical protein [Thalassospira xianhensis]RCK07770.1 hypothetical protein TH5_01625 [Thalassospira xianhensis MCCC 1A02616]